VGLHGANPIDSGIPARRLAVWDPAAVAVGMSRGSASFDAVLSRSSMTKRMSVTASSPAATQIACNPNTRVVNVPAIAPAANAPIKQA
jgi:hypothetical protein